MENINKEIIKRNQTNSRATVNEMKNSLEVFNRFKQEEESVSFKTDKLK